MSTYILTSMFNNGFNEAFVDILQKLNVKGKFTFVASEFEKIHEKTDKYFHFFLDMFEKAGIHFDEACVVDGRMEKEQAQNSVREADVVWISGGDTPTEFRYLKEYGLDSIIKEHTGVIIGMSAGSINLAKTAICTLSCGHYEQEIYDGLGCVDISVEPHFVRENLTDELIELSKKHTIYGLCDESFIVCSKGKIEFYGEVYKIGQGFVETI